MHHGNPSKINMKSIIHISDLHFGRPFVQDAGRAVLRFLEENSHDALICSGDIVQFAEIKSSWEEARDFFSQVAAPTVIVPGNHDVLRFFPVARWLTPMNRYFEYINAHRDMKVHLPGLDVVGLGTMRTWTIELGFITKKQLGYVEDSFKESAANNFRVLVQHQSPKRFFKGLLPTHVRGYKRALKTYAKTGVDLILTGHNHFVHAEAIEQDGHSPIKNGFFGGVSSYVKAVNDVTFDVYPGETLGLVGESGCGKTTIGRTILRLEEPTEGEMIYKGQDIAKMTADELRSFRKEVQIIFQDPYSSLNPRMTIGNAIMEPMQVHNILENDEQRKEKVKELLTKVSLDPAHFYRYPHEFSGGQRQRIGIARALAVNPKFIICDESVSALDVSVQAQVLNLLNDLKEEFGLTYIFISHDLSVVKYMSDRMVVMQEGEIEEMGDADQIYNAPKTDYTKKLIDAIPEGKLEDIKGHLEKKGISVS